MEQDLDILLQQRIERFYTRLVKAYEKRMNVAKDKEYTHEQYVKRAKAGALLKKEWNENYNTIIEMLDEAYKLGNPISTAIKQLKSMPVAHQECIEKMPIATKNKSQKQQAASLIELLKTPLSEFEVKDEVIDINQPEKEQSFAEWKLLSDIELTCMFADQKAKEKFRDYIQSQDGNLKNEKDVDIQDKESEKGKNKEFTTARQVMTVHFMLEYMQVRNIDNSEKARFIHFLTGKNYHNIYKRVLSPFNLSDKFFKDDLRYVRTYFEKLGLREIVKMINNELDKDI